MAPNSGQGIDIGDAVLTFLGDSTQLDAAFDSVGDRAKTGLKPASDALDDVQDGFKGAGKAGEEAADEIEDAGKRSSQSLREAKGEAALLGEEFGIRLPRHVRSFIAELPGVGEAMSAAFSATAILFVAQAIAKAADKASEWAAKLAFASDEVKTNQDALVAANAEVLNAAKAYEAAKKALDGYGKSKSQLAQEEEIDLTHQLTQAQKALADAQAEVAKGVQKTGQAYVMTSEVTGEAVAEETKQDRQNYEAKQNLVFVNQALIRSLKEQIEAQKKTKVDPAIQEEFDKDHKKRVDAYYQEVDLEERLAAQRKKIDEEYAAEISDKTELSIAANKKLGDSLRQLGALGASQFGAVAIGYQHLADMTATVAKAHEDLSHAVIMARRDLELFRASGVQNDEVLKLLTNNLKAAKEAQDNYGKETGNTLKERIKDARATLEQTEAELELAKARGADVRAMQSEITMQQNNIAKMEASEKALVKEKTSMMEFQDVAKGVMSQLGNDMDTIMAGIVSGQKHLGAEMKKMTFDMLASMAKQYAEYYMALATANLFTPGMQAAAAGEFAGAIALEALAGTMTALGGSGGAGSSNNASVFQNNNGGSDTGGAGRGGTSVLGVQHFATGGLITAPTLAVMGEQNRAEAVLPLEDPRAMANIGKSISAAGGGGGIHIHLPHGSIISADTMQKFIGKMNKMVSRGQANLKSSSSLRLNKRSA